MAKADTAAVMHMPLVDKPKLLATHGRGGTGKSTFVRAIVEIAHAAGRSPAIADADRTNATLPGFFSDVSRPSASDDRSVSDWLDGVVNAQADGRVTVVLDMGGGDQVFKRFAQDLQLAALLEQEGVMPVAVHCIGPDLDDLAYLDDVEKSGAFCPVQTILVLNEGKITDGRPREAAFADVLTHPVIEAAVKRGARQIWFPRLGCMQEVNARRLSFATAERELGLTNRQRVAIWRRAVNEALQPVAAWLP